MKKMDITYEDKVGELFMDVKHPNNSGKTYILVEGESDIRIFRKIFHPDNCKIESIPGGNPKVEKATNDLLKVYSLVFGIRDSDFIKLGGDLYPHKDVFLTDMHDIEMCLISMSDVFSSIIFENTAITQDRHAEVRERIISAISDVSLLKWLNCKEDLQLCFDSSGFQDLICFDTDKVDIDTYLRRVLSKSQNAKLNDVAIIKSKIEELKETSLDPFLLCNGHDFIKSLSGYLINKHQAKNVSEAILSSAVRVAFTNEMWKGTQLYAQTTIWAEEKGRCIYA